MKPETYIIGDIHGAFRALEQVISQAPLQAADTLIFLGDYVDGWSQSAEVIDYLITLRQTYSCIFIRGNHDTWCESWLQGGKADATWLFHGGQSTVTSYSNLPDAIKKEHLEFFNRMQDYYVDANNDLFIHAGYTSMHGPAKEVHASDYSWDRTLWETALSADPALTTQDLFFPKRLSLFRNIYIGHTPTTHYNVFTPMQALNVWNIDTGAAFHGKLTMMQVSTKQYWQSETVQTLYPGEKGRNKD